MYCERTLVGEVVRIVSGGYDAQTFATSLDACALIQKMTCRLLNPMNSVQAISVIGQTW